MNIFKRITVALMASVIAVALLSSCALRKGEVSEEAWDEAMVFTQSLTGFTQTLYSADKETPTFSFSVKYDGDTLYRIETGADGLVDYELYIQITNSTYTQYRNTYTDNGEPRSFTKSRASRDLWKSNRSFLYGIDEKYGLDEFIVFDDFEFNAEESIYYSKELPVLYDGVIFRDVTVRFDEKGRLVELNFTQVTTGDKEVRLCQTFEYDGGDVTLPENVF